jgi:hypothetical protein
MDPNVHVVHKTAPMGYILNQTDLQPKTKNGSNLNNPWPCVKLIRYENEANKSI